MSVFLTSPSCVTEVVALCSVVAEVLYGNGVVEIEQNGAGRATFLEIAYVVPVQSSWLILALYLVLRVVMDALDDLHHSIRYSQKR